jgi:transposase
MTQWATAPASRDQLVLFSESLDSAIPPGHTVRLLDSILSRLSWTHWEQRYHTSLGQPAIHPSVLASVLLYGMLTRIRSSRGLEDAIQVRMDFRWLVSGRTIDHSTLSKFRHRHSKELKRLFILVCQAAREAGFLKLQQLGYDGTRVRANNRRSGTRTPEVLEKERQGLATEFDKRIRELDAEDSRDEELFESDSSQKIPAELQDQQQQIDRLDAILQDLTRLEDEGRNVPKRVPITDHESRVMPNKEGGHAPNYTPLATVDIASGMIVDADVLNVVNEDGHLLSAVQSVRENFSLDPSVELMIMTDSLNSTGANLAASEEHKINIISPCPIPDAATNAALRADPTQPVPPSEWDRLPVRTVKAGGPTQLDKSAFVYDAQRDCYWCPQGQPMEKAGTTSEKSGSGRRIRTRYQAAPSACAGCPLRDRCVLGKAESRQINREQYEEHRERHAVKMAQPASQDLYKLRRHPGERPFAVIKQQFGLRQFLLRGLDRVRSEWLWAATAFNLQRLMSLIMIRAGPH